MKQILIITLACLLFSAPLFGQVQQSGVLYLWEISAEKVWKRFGDDETQQKYKGEIKDEKPDGLGIRLFLDGTKYMGQWQEGQQHGQGTLSFADGSKLTGEWKEDKEWNIIKYDVDGRVKDKYVDGVKLVNNRKAGVLFFRQEEGLLDWYETGDETEDYKYVGEVENGKPNGWGIFTYPSGEMYEGEYKDGKTHGQGSFSYPDGKKGVGEFRENKPWNITEFDNESNIIGEYVEGVLKVEIIEEGILFTYKEDGKWIWLENGNAGDGGKYEGQIENGKPNGRGSLIYRNGTRYEGKFKDGRWDGRGTFSFPDGEKWVGEFKDDAPWNINWYDKGGKIIATWGNGVKQ